MRAFKKALMAFAAVTAVSAAFAATSFAANPVANYADGKVTIPEGYITYNDETTQMTVLLIEASKDDGSIAEEDILYINQAAAKGDATFGEMGVKGGELAPGDYILKVGSNADGFELMVFDVKVEDPSTEPEEDVWCDVNVDYSVNIKDATALVGYIAGTGSLSYDEGSDEFYARCDANLDTEVNIKDATAIVGHIAGTAEIPGLKTEKN